MKLIFEKSSEGRRAFNFSASPVPPVKLNSKYLRRENAELPEVSEVGVVRHFTALSKRAYGVDDGFYPLGSCTMKYNPKINEKIAAIENFADMHPYQPEETAQGSLEVMYHLEKSLCEVTGMDSFSLQPAAGAHGEFLGLLIIKSYFAKRGDRVRVNVIIPDSAHGTNPASAAMCGFNVITLPSLEDGSIDLDKLEMLANEKTAALMLTNPSTIGLFESKITKIAEIIHRAGGKLYYDGANLNAVMGIVRPGDMGFDVMHLNLHKTFSTPHGGGGPGSGPVGCKGELADFLPVPKIGYSEEKDKYYFYGSEDSCGKVQGYYGNFAVYLRAYAYICSLGADGLKYASENAVLNANYMMKKLSAKYKIAYDKTCMHEFVLDLGELKKETGISAMDIAKSMIDRGIHPPTMYFPLIVHEALMFEPTETESIETLDEISQILLDMYDLAYRNPDELKNSPKNMPVSRPDEVTAARNPNIRWLNQTI